MQRILTSVLLIPLVALLLMLAPNAVAQPAQPNAVAPQLTATPHPDQLTERVFLPLTFSYRTPSTTPKVAFWASRYTLPQGGCATLTWDVVGATAVWLDGASVGLTGTQQACPTNTEFYTLEAQFGGPVGVQPAAPQGAVVEIREVVLTAGDPMLAANEVVAQAQVSQITLISDIDPQTAGNQPGYQVGLNDGRPLYTGTPGWNHAQTTLVVPQVAIEIGPNGPVHWPLRVGQSVEFRAACDGAACLLD